MGERKRFIGEPRRRIMTAVVEEAAGWAAAVEDAVFRARGWHSTRAAARHDVARRTGVSEATLKRLRAGPAYWPADIMASAYVALKAEYERVCEAVEARADHHQHIREALERGRQTDTQPLPAAHSMDPAQARREEKE